MKPKVETISGKVNLALLDKADRLFRNDDAGPLIEVLQNARRTGATAIDVFLEEAQGKSGECRITVQDDDRGLENFQSLLTLGASDWCFETMEKGGPGRHGVLQLVPLGR